METLAFIFFTLAGIVLAMGIVFVIMFYQPIGGDEYFNDDIPARYEDHEVLFYDP
jgi:hypothetical protein